MCLDCLPPSAHLLISEVTVKIRTISWFFCTFPLKYCKNLPYVFIYYHPRCVLVKYVGYLFSYFTVGKFVVFSH